MPNRAGPLTGVAPVIGLPGYPLATAVIFELFAAPHARGAHGAVPARRGAAPGHGLTTVDWASPADVEVIWVLRHARPGGPDGRRPRGPPPARQGSASSISQLARADAWWPIPAGQGDLPAGAVIGVLPIR